MLLKNTRKVKLHSCLERVTRKLLKTLTFTPHLPSLGLRFHHPAFSEGRARQLLEAHLIAVSLESRLGTAAWYSQQKELRM